LIATQILDGVVDLISQEDDQLRVSAAEVFGRTLATVEVDVAAPLLKVMLWRLLKAMPLMTFDDILMLVTERTLCCCERGRRMAGEEWTGVKHCSFRAHPSREYFGSYGSSPECLVCWRA
jgi:hypothetical protein